jgi:hypothetical protein
LYILYRLAPPKSSHPGRSIRNQNLHLQRDVHRARKSIVSVHRHCTCTRTTLKTQRRYPSPNQREKTIPTKHPCLRNFSIVIQCQSNDQDLHLCQHAIRRDQSKVACIYPATICTWAGLAPHGPARETNVAFPQATFGPMRPKIFTTTGEMKRGIKRQCAKADDAQNNTKRTG